MPDVTIRSASEQALFVGKGRLTNLVAGPDQDIESFSAVRVLFPPGHTSEMHAKEETTEIVYVLEGELTLETESDRYTIEEDSVVVIPKGVAHQHRNETELDLKHLVLMTPPGPEEVFKDREELRYVEHDADMIP